MKINKKEIRKILRQGGTLFLPGKKVPGSIPFIGGRVVPQGNLGYYIFGYPTTAVIKSATPQAVELARVFAKKSVPVYEGVSGRNYIGGEPPENNQEWVKSPLTWEQLVREIGVPINLEQFERAVKGECIPLL